MLKKTRKLTKEEKELLNFEKKCLICMENLVDCIMSPCNHGDVCFHCAKTSLNNKNSCYYCRDVRLRINQNVLRVYQVKASTSNPSIYKVVRSYLVYDSRENYVFVESDGDYYNDEASNEADIENENHNDEDLKRENDGEASSPEVVSAQSNEPAQSHDSVQGSHINSVMIWAAGSRPAALNLPNLLEAYQVDLDQLSYDSRSFSEECSMDRARKRVDSCEIDYKGDLASNYPEKIYEGAILKNTCKRCILKSFDSLNQIDDESNNSNKGESEAPANTIKSPLPQVRRRLRSTELSTPTCLVHPTADLRPTLKPINEESEHF